MRLKKLRDLAKPLLVCVALSAPGSALAVPITGGIGFGGAFAPTGGSDLSDATGINFLTAFVLGGSGTFAGVPSFTGASFTDFDFDPVLNPNPVDPLWAFSFAGSDYAFTLGDVVVEDQTVDILSLSGSGMLSATGFDDTSGLWTFTGNAAGDIVFTFSSITAAVPEPATLLLMGLGLIGVGVARRRRR